MLRKNNISNTKMNRIVFKTVISAVLSCVIMLCPLSASATTTELDDVPNTTYTYWQGYTPKRALPMQAVYTVDQILDTKYFGGVKLEGAQHICTDSAGETLYILDSERARILLISLTDYSLKEEISALSYEGESISFYKARGIFVSDDGYLYIADSENARVLIINNNRQIEHILYFPEAESMPENFRFVPTRVVKDSKNYVYVLSEGCYYGAITYNENLEFCGFFGANTVQNTVLGAITKLITSLFETDAKRESSLQKLPTEFSDICISRDGFLYTVSSDTQGQLRKLGPKGTNNLVYASGYGYQNADSFNFADFPNKIYRSWFTWTLTMSGLAIDEQGFIYMVDNVKGRIYMYDSDCRLICVFGNSLNAGSQTGKFLNPTAIACAKDKLFVLDNIKGNITVMKTTDYGNLVMTADSFTLEGEYEHAKPYWEKVLTYDKNSQIAYTGLAKAAYITGDYNLAMEYAEQGLDMATYAQAFSVQSTEFLKNNFLWIAVICLLAVGGLVFFALYTKHHEVTLVKNEKLRTALSVPTHPFASLNDIKYKNKGSMLIATIIIIVYFFATAGRTLYGGFMYVGVAKENFNLLFSLLGTLGVLLLWIIVNWGVCILMDGKGFLKEVYIVSAYCMIPQIISSILFIVLSHVVVASNFSALGVITMIFNIYTIIILLIGMSVVHEFSFFRSIATAVLTVLGILLVAFLLFVFFMLMQDFAGFVIGIVREIILR